MKRWMMPLAAVVVALVVIFAALPYWFGMRAEASMKQHQQLVQQNPLLDVVSYEYERGWFSSKETTVLRLKANLLNKFGSNVPENIKAIVNEPFTITNHIQHGPFADGLQPVKAVAVSEVAFSPRAQQSLERFFQSQVPLSVTNRLSLFGGGVMKVTVPAFEYEELSGIVIDWKGLNIQLDYQDNYDAYQVLSQSAGIHIKLADKGQVHLQDIQYKASSTQNAIGLKIGDNELTLAQASMKWAEGVDYNIKLNSLINMVSDLQIGAFINPNGTIAPSEVMIKGFALKRGTNEENGFANAQAHIHFDQFQYGKDQYGPLDVQASAEHLHAESLVKLNDEFFRLSNTSLNEQEYREALLQLAKTEALPIFTNNPVFKISQFDLKMPDGQLKFSAQFGFQGLQAADMESFNALMAKTEGKIHLNAPQVLLENLAVAQADSIFSVDPDVENPPSMDEVRQTARLLVRSTLDGMGQAGYLTQENGMIDSQITISNNQLLFNGKRFQTEPQQSIDDLMQEDEAIEPASDVKIASGVQP